ncbi:FadR/GntR family transcriptional regulator [Tropicimonas sediminicola]|uniref:Transcriptional regulator, GntR family n=1 Tax=Tropicimonas sediminicola TaxID=1031541 RepID=A0A239J1Q4_9RHOB|nr:FadR/GntR family transcriptional regulator [Tropicimonas sediminicola]SNS99739.1 transcriptional regulator, GntR family [Tropicimonas sediminicola]
MTKLGDQLPVQPVASNGGGPVSREAAVAALRRLIELGNYAPGDRLPPERELIVQLGLTRAALRKALETLEAEGLIWRHVGKGTFIASEGEGAVAGRLHDLAKQITPVKMMRARIAIEPAIAREAAMNASTEALARIEDALTQTVNAPTWDEYEQFDDLLHRRIALATDNPLLISLFDQLNQVRRAVAWGTVVRASIRPPADHTSFGEHARIAETIAARDANGAQEAMRKHLASVAARLFGEV